MSDFKAKMHQKALKSTKFDFGWGFAQAPLEELTLLLQTPSWI